MIQTQAVDSARLQSDLAALAEFRDPDQSGWTRRVFSKPYVQSRSWVAERMASAGLALIRDAAGNLVGTLSGASRRALVAGSHTDTVAGGGRFDGPLGVLAAIEVARCIRDSGRPLRHDLRVVDFVGEEPNDFGLSCIGSRAVAGTLTDEQLASRDPSGRTLAEAILTVAGPGRVASAAWSPDSIEAYVELHIEQGPVLANAGIPLGVVTGIAGIARAHVTFDGRADHAGTTPMSDRHDALCAAADAVLEAERIGSEGGGVATVGRIESAPGALNVVPEQAQVWVELRSVDPVWLDSRMARFESFLREASERRGVSAEVKRLSRTEPVMASAGVIDAMTGAIRGIGLEFMMLPSGAGHDAVQIARLGPVGMLFVPSVGGRSHCPEELTLPEHVAAGAQALLATVMVLDAR